MNSPIRISGEGSAFVDLELGDDELEVEVEFTTEQAPGGYDITITAVTEMETGQALGPESTISDELAQDILAAHLDYCERL